MSDDEEESIPPWRAIGSEKEFDEVMAELKPEQLCMVQFKAIWCTKCVSVAIALKKDVPKDMLWLTVDVDVHQNLAERFDVVQMPRIDLHTGGRVVESLKAFDVTKQNVLDAIARAGTRPELELDADF